MMLNDKKTQHISKFLSLILRHQPEKIGLQLDPQGWADVDQLMRNAPKAGYSIDRSILEHVVITNNKKRFAFNEDGTKIRASQGHSIAIDLDSLPQEPPKVLYHGTGQHSLAAILKEGIQKRARQHVHLSSDVPTAINVGRSHGKPVVLEIAALAMHRQQHLFYLSANKVWLTDVVPPQFIRLVDEDA